MSDTAVTSSAPTLQTNPVTFKQPTEVKSDLQQAMYSSPSYFMSMMDLKSSTEVHFRYWVDLYENLYAPEEVVTVR